MKIFQVSDDLPQLYHTVSPVISRGNVFFASANGRVYHLEEETNYPAGELLSTLEILDAKRIIGDPFKYDFEKDGHCEFVVGTEDRIILNRQET